MRYLVIASCEDARTGVEFQPGDEFLPEPDPVQAERLISARCLRLIDSDSPLLPVDGREGVLVTQLRSEIAALTDDLATAKGQTAKVIVEAGAELSKMRAENDSRAKDNARLVAEHETQAARIAELETEIAAKSGHSEEAPAAADGAPSKPVKAK